MNFSGALFHSPEAGVYQPKVYDHIQPGDPKSLESPNEADIVWRLFIQILFRQITNFSPSI